MSNTIGNLTNALGILKNFYAGPIVSQFNDEIPLYKEIEKGSEKFNGLQVVRPIKTRRNQGVGATSDGGILPNIGKQTTAQATISAKFNYLRFGITAPLIKASQGDKGSFTSIMSYEMSEGMTDLKTDVNRQIFWDGTSDLAVVSANAIASNTITVTSRSTGENGNKYIDIGAQIDIYTAAGALVASSVNVTNTSLSGVVATLTLDSAVTTSATDIVVRSGSFGNEIQGLMYTLDGGTSTIYSIDRSTATSFQGNVVSAASAQLNLNLMKQAYNLPRSRGGSKMNALYTDFDSERFYEKLLIADKRYIGKTKGDGTFASSSESYLEYAGIPMVADKDCPGASMFMLDTKGWKKYVLSELEWADETGSYMIAQSGVDAFEVRLRLFANLFCEKPSAQALLSGYISP